MSSKAKKEIAIIGAGPAGLMAAEILAESGCSVTIYDRMASPGRKLLIAGRGGLNLTHSEELEVFIKRYGSAAEWMRPYINAFTPNDLRKWCEDIGQETFVGSSGRIFPKDMKAVKLLRAWLKKLEALGVKYMPRHRWLGWEDGSLKFTNANKQQVLVKPAATLLALGGASWPRLGSDGAWEKLLEAEGVKTVPLKPSNSGFIINWSEYFSNRFAGTPIKSVTLTHKNISKQGEAMITAKGIEGGAVYALSAALRESIEKEGEAILFVDLKPGIDEATLAQKLSVKGDRSLSTNLKRAGLPDFASSLLHEVMTKPQIASATPEVLAATLKKLPLKLIATADIARAISSAGGIDLNELDENLMLKKNPGVFAAGEMLDWEAPTGGYLLQGCLSTAVAAAKGILAEGY